MYRKDRGSLSSARQLPVRTTLDAHALTLFLIFRRKILPSMLYYNTFFSLLQGDETKKSNGMADLKKFGENDGKDLLLRLEYGIIFSIMTVLPTMGYMACKGAHDICAIGEFETILT